MIKRKILNAILILCMLLSVMAIPAYDSLALNKNEDENNNSLLLDNFSSEYREVLSQEEVSPYIDYEMAVSNGHVRRLPHEEELNTIVYLNSDNSKTIYYYDDNIKYINSYGNVIEKNIGLKTVTDGYTTERNDVSLVLPNKLSDGISVSYKENTVKLIPLIFDNSLSQNATVDTTVLSNKTADFNSAKNEVAYNSVFGSNTNLKYAPTLRGMKEEIVLSSYTGTNSWSFIAQTNGMAAYCGDDGIYYFAESSDAETKFSLGRVCVYDSACNIDGGTMTVTPVKENALYIITITVDSAFLTNANTVYPVYVDPQINITNESTTTNILDTTIYSVKNTTNTGTWTLNHAGYYSDSYGVGRILVKLPGLMTNAEFLSMLDSSPSISVKFYISEATGSGGQSFSLHEFTGCNWSETTATWNNCNPNSYASSATATATPGANEFGEFNITSLVRRWVLGVSDYQYGFIIKNTNETDGAKCRAFIANNYSNTARRPKVSVTYTQNTSFVESTVDVLEGSTASLIKTSIPTGATVTWSSDNTAVATVNSSGVVTGVRAGYATVTATVTGAGATYTIESDIYVIFPDGVYYIKNNYSSKYLEVQSGSIAENTSLVQSSKSTTDPSRLKQLWKIKYAGDACYTIRPMHKLDMCMYRISTSVFTTKRPSDDVYYSNNESWSFEWDQNGYKIHPANNFSDMLSLSSASTNTGITIKLSENSSHAMQRWSVEKLASPPNGVVLYNTKTIIAPHDEVGFIAGVYSGQTINQNVTWTSSNTNVATVNSDGLVIGVAQGTATITARSAYNSSWSKSISVQVSAIPNGIYYLRNNQTDKMLDIDGPSTSANAIIHQWQYYGHDSQRWNIELQSDGYYTIKSVYSSLYLSVKDNSSSNNATVTQLSGGTATGQRWQFTKLSDGSYKICAKSGESSGMCLSVADYTSNDNGIVVKQMTYTNDSNHKDEWLLEQLNVNVELSFDAGFIQRNGTSASTISDKLVNTYFRKVSVAFERNFGIKLDFASVQSYTSDADRCPSSGINQNCSCISTSNCVLEYDDNPNNNNSTNGFEHQCHCKSITRLRNNLIVGIPSNTIRITYTGHVICEYLPPHEFNNSTIALSDYTYPIICIRQPQDNDRKSILIMAHEISHLYQAVHHEYISGEPCIMDNSFEFQSVDVDDYTTYWCSSCAATIMQNASRYQ